MTELKGVEERKGPHRINGAEHGVHPDRKTWLEERDHELATLGISGQPHVVIGGGGQGGHCSGRPTAPAGRAGDHRREERQTRRQLAQALQVPVPTRPGLVRPPALPPRQNSCRLHRSTSGAAMKDGLGSIRTGIQGQGGSEVAAPGERGDRRRNWLL